MLSVCNKMSEDKYNSLFCLEKGPNSSVYCVILSHKCYEIERLKDGVAWYSGHPATAQ